MLILSIIAIVWVAAWERDVARRADGKLPPPSFIHIDGEGRLLITGVDGEVLTMER